MQWHGEQIGSHGADWYTITLHDGKNNNYKIIVVLTYLKTTQSLFQMPNFKRSGKVQNVRRCWLYVAIDEEKVGNTF